MNRMRGLPISVLEPDFSVHDVVFQPVPGIDIPDVGLRILPDPRNPPEVDAPGIPDPKHPVSDDAHVHRSVVAEDAPVVLVTADVVNVILPDEHLPVDGPGVDGPGIHQVAGEIGVAIQLVVLHDARGGSRDAIPVMRTDADRAVGEIGEHVVVDRERPTPQLETEGLARELVSKIQQMRKQNDYEMMDNIKIFIDADDDVKGAIEAYKDYIMKETLAVEICGGDAAGGELAQVNLNGHKSGLALERV